MNFLKEHKLTSLKVNFHKKVNKLWTQTYPTGIKTQLDYILINKKRKNNCMDCQSYNSNDNVRSDNRIVTSTIRLRCRANKQKSNQPPKYDWSLLHSNKELCYTFIVSLRNRFNVLQSETIETVSTNKCL